MDPEELVVLLGAVLALVFAYFPWVKDWFDGLDSEWKPLLNAGLLLVLALALVGVSCTGLAYYFECSTAGVVRAIFVWLLALVSNRLTYVYAVRQFAQKRKQ